MSEALTLPPRLEAIVQRHAIDAKFGVDSRRLGWPQATLAHEDRAWLLEVVGRLHERHPDLYATLTEGT